MSSLFAAESGAIPSVTHFPASNISRFPIAVQYDYVRMPICQEKTVIPRLRSRGANRAGPRRMRGRPEGGYRTVPTTGSTIQCPQHPGIPRFFPRRSASVPAGRLAHNRSQHLKLRHLDSWTAPFVHQKWNLDFPIHQDGNRRIIDRSEDYRSSASHKSEPLIS